MARISSVAKELCFLGVLFLGITILATMAGHDNAGLLGIVTVLMFFLMLVAQLSHRMDVKTLSGRGKRKGK